MRRPIAALITLLALVGGGWWLADAPDGNEWRDPEGEEEGELRAPTEGRATAHDQEEGAGRNTKAARELWMAQKHRAAPGVDWQQVERENGLAQVRKRNALRGAAPPPAGSPRWVERGSDNQAGSTFVARPGTDPEVLYVGSALGGLWRGTVDGDGWTPIGDNLYGGVNWLEVLPPVVLGDPDVLLAGTDGGLLARSTDNGASWNTPVGWASVSQMRRLLVTSGGSVLAVAVSGRNTSLLRSTDGGATFTLVADLGRTSGDVWAARDGGTAIFTIGDEGVLRSDDDAGTWTVVGAIPTDFGTAELTGSEAGAPTLYAALDGEVLWRSDDAGASWGEISPLTDYWGTLNASIEDPRFFAYGGMELHKSSDGGESFVTQNAWWEYYGTPESLLHADMMGIDVLLDPDGHERWYINSHGGTYRSEDRLLSVENLSLKGLRVSQYYDVLTSSANPDHVAAGAQDQGYQITQGVIQDGDTILDFYQATSGDYGHLTSGDGTHDYVYSVYPGVILIQVGEDEPELKSAPFPTDESNVPWLPPIVADPDDPTVFYFPATHLYRYARSARQWSPELYGTRSFAVDRNEYVSIMAFSPVDHDRAWIATSSGRCYWSTDHGLNWTQSESLVPDDNWYYGQAIAPSPTDPNIVTIGGSGYSVPAVYRSTDGGVTFFPWSEGLPDTLVYTLVEAPDGSGRVFAGTQTAAYMRGAADAAWVDITGHDAPITIYWDAEALTAENTIRFATYGRGIWDYQLGEAGDSGDSPADTDPSDTDPSDDWGEPIPDEGTPGKAGSYAGGCGCVAAPLSSRSAWIGGVLGAVFLSTRRRRPLG